MTPLLPPEAVLQRKAVPCGGRVQLLGEVALRVEDAGAERPRVGLTQRFVDEFPLTRRGHLLVAAFFGGVGPTYKYQAARSRSVKRGGAGKKPNGVSSQGSPRLKVTWGGVPRLAALGGAGGGREERHVPFG